MSGRRHCLKCTLKIAVCSEERVGSNILGMLSYSFGNLHGDYDHVYFMFVSQLYPHHEQSHIHDWSTTVFSREMAGAIKRRVVHPPTQGVAPPNDDDPIHPDQHGDVPPNNDDDMLSGDEPEDPLGDGSQPDHNTGPDPDDDDDQE